MDITIFELTRCPYCAWERELVDELKQEHPEYNKLKINRVLEDEQPEVAKEYDYYYVPSIFKGKLKLMEANPKWDRKKMRNHIDEVFRDLINVDLKI